MTPYAYRDLPAAAFPFTVEFISQRTGKVVHAFTAAGPGVITVPALRDEHGPVDVRVTYADGFTIYEKATTRGEA